MNDNLVSIIVPIYNVEKYIYKCVDSILNQTYSNIEIILVNDGSLDNCPVICDELQKNDSRIKVIHKDNGGLSDARNAGLHEALGQYVVFIDGDDYAESNMIEKALKAATSNQADIVQWGFYVDFENHEKEVYKSTTHTVPSTTLQKSEYKNLKVDLTFLANLGYAWNKMYSTKLLRDNSFAFTKGLSLIEDIVFNSPVYAVSSKITFIEDPLIHYMQRPRITLGTAVYKDYYKLKLQALTSINNLLESWEIDSNNRKDVISLLFFNNLKSYIKMLSTAKSNPNKQVSKDLRKVFKSKEAEKYLKDVKAQTKKDEIILQLMKLKQGKLLLFFYKKMA